LGYRRIAGGGIAGETVDLRGGTGAKAGSGIAVVIEFDTVGSQDIIVDFYFINTTGGKVVVAGIEGPDSTKVAILTQIVHGNIAPLGGNGRGAKVGVEIEFDTAALAAAIVGGSEVDPTIGGDGKGRIDSDPVGDILVIKLEGKRAAIAVGIKNPLGTRGDIVTRFGEDDKRSGVGEVDPGADRKRRVGSAIAKTETGMGRNINSLTIVKS